MLALAAACGGGGRLTPEAARAKGDAMLKEMSQTLVRTQTFSYRAEQAIERVKAGGERVTDRFTRRTIVQRPNRLTFTDQGPEHDAAAWYDGKRLTVVSNREKVWVRGPMPATLDEALDYVSSEYDIQIATADLLYSSPYEALITPDTTGGWVGVEQVDARSCERLSYQHALVDWQVWLSQNDSRLPCQLEITYKSVPGQPVTRIVFHDWNASPVVSETTFAPTVPEGYRRIRIMRHATIVDETVKEQGGSDD
jgi:hypothetical protein